MRLRLASIAVVFLVFGLSVAHAQYIEIYKLDSLMKDIPESMALSSVASNLSVPADTLKQEKAEYKVTLGELYVAHQIAKLSNSDLKSVMTDSKSKAWGEVAKARNIDMDQIKNSSKNLEKSLREASSKK